MTTASTTTGQTANEESPVTTTCNGLKVCTNDDFLERLARLATTPRGPDSAPLQTYRTASTEHGEIYTATSEYVNWLRRKIPGYGDGGSVTRAASSRTAPGEGEIQF